MFINLKNKILQPFRIKVKEKLVRKINYDFSVTKIWHEGWKRNLDKITEICIHHTGGTGPIIPFLRWMKFTGRPGYKKGIGLFPFVIDLESDIYQIGELTRWWYASSCGWHDRKVINIELIHLKGEFKKEQYEELNWLIFSYLFKQCPNIKKITGHDFNLKYWSKKPPKGCPSRWFKWNKLKHEKYKLNKIDEHCYGVKKC